MGPFADPAILKENEFILSKQLLRSGTSIGANVEEAQAGQSRADFISKMSIASKNVCRKRDGKQAVGKLTLAELEGNDYVLSLRNRLIAEAFYLTGDIERYGTGFVRIREFLCGYPEVTHTVEEKGDFFWAELRLAAEQVTEQVTAQVTRLLQVIGIKPTNRRELQAAIGLTHREHFRAEYLQPALQAGVIEMTKPDNPRAADQKYFLTDKGKGIIDRDARGHKDD